jgi:colicin import membrane protein
MSEGPEVDSASREINGMMRVALQLASRIAEKMARNRERDLEQARRESTERARELAQRLETDRAGVEAYLRASFDDQWWNRAQPGEIADQWQHAQAWREHSQVAVEATERIRTETAKRYGIDVNAPGADEKIVDSLLRDAENRQARAGAVRGRARSDTMTASEILDEAERADAERSDETERNETNGEDVEPQAPGGDSLRSVAEHDYDSAERRGDDADQMRAAGLAEEEVDTRMRADLDQARHPVEAVTGEGSHPKARKGRARRGKSAERTMTGR